MTQATPTEAATNAIALMLQDNELKKAMDEYIDARILLALRALSGRIANSHHSWDTYAELTACKRDLFLSYEARQAITQTIKNAIQTT